MAISYTELLEELILIIGLYDDQRARISTLRSTEAPAFALQVAEATMKDGACLFASGTASTNVLAANRARFDWAGPDLSGPVDCIDGRLRVRLSGEGGTETVAAVVTTGFDGVYQSDVTVMTTDPAAGNVLTLFGFNPAGSGEYRLSEQGRWR